MKKYFFVLLSFSLTFCMKSKDKLYSYVEVRRPMIHGWCSAEKSRAMMDLIVKIRPETCVEVGVFAGSSIFPTAMALKYNQKGKVYAIDPWSTEECLKGMTREKNREWWESFDIEDIYNKYITLLSNEKINKYTCTLRMTSEEALAHVPEEIDILHIDGNHCEAAALFDVENYIPKVKLGGYVWLDDVFWNELDNTPKKMKKIKTAAKALEYALKYCDVVLKVDNGNCVLLEKKRV